MTTIRLTEFGSLIETISPRGHQIDSLGYARTGRFPIVDQSETLIVGYTDDETKVLRQVPLVVFGDHTRTVKLVDFPFVVGADGTKLLRPARQDICTGFLAHLTAFAAGLIPNLGYSRHFKELKEAKVWVPPRPEQKAIAAVLRTWDDGIAAANRLVAKRRAALAVARRRLVEMAEGDSLPIGEIATNTNKLLEVSAAAESDLPCIELEHLEEATGRILGSAAPDALKGARRAFGPGDVLFGRLRPYLRKFAAPDFSGVCSTEVWVLAARPEVCLPGYLYQIVQTESFIAQANKSSGSRMPRADWALLADTAVPVPPLERQRQVARLLAAEEEATNLLSALHGRLCDQKRALMSRLLSGDLRAPASLLRKHGGSGPRGA